MIVDDAIDNTHRVHNFGVASYHTNLTFFVHETLRRILLLLCGGT